MKFTYRRKLSYLLILFYGVTQSSSAQTDVSKFEWGVHAGTYTYQGDLSPSKFGSYKSPGLGIGFFGSKILSSSFSVRVNLDFGKVREDEMKYADPLWRQDRNLKFNTKAS